MFLALAPIISHAFLLTVSSFNTGVPQALSWITLIMVASCAALAYRQSMAIVNPIANLVRAMQRLEEGEFNARSTAKTVGELRTLQSRFNKMCAALAVRQDQLRNHAHEAIEELNESLRTVRAQNIELETAKNAAFERNEAKSEFLSHVSHEIQTPMTGVLGYCNLLLKTSLSPEQNTYTSAIKHSCESAVTIASEILDLAKIEAGHLRLDSVEFDPRRCLESALEVLAPIAESKELALTHNVAHDVPLKLLGDPLRIRQILLNLGTNAIKFTFSGEVSFSVEVVQEDKAGVHLRYCVSDTGVGIRSEDTQHLFRAFYRADASSPRMAQGSGLGLNICKKLAERMHGEMGVTSQPGAGSTFWFTAAFEHQRLPQRQTKPRLAAKVPLSTDWLKGALQFLIVDDDPISRKLLATLLAQFHIGVSIAHDGWQALEEFAKGQFDAVLMDVHMPGMDGVTLATKLRGIEREGTHTPMIAVTADAMRRNREKYLNTALDDHLTKPFDEEKLWRVIHKWVLKRESSSSKTSPYLPQPLNSAENPLTTKDILRPSPVARRILPMLLGELPSLRTKINDAFSQANMHAIAEHAHTLAGGAAACGVPGIRSLSERLHQAARADRIDAVAKCIESLNCGIDKLLAAPAQTFAPDTQHHGTIHSTTSVV